MKRRAVTIKDLASKLNMSVSTVSRALRNMPEIKAETKKKVLDLAEQLEYEPNAIASSLVSKKTFLIGVLVPELDMQFFSTLIKGAQDQASKNGYNVLIIQSNESYSRELESTKAMITSRLDGMIVSVSRKTKDFSHFEKLMKKNMPLVFVDRIPNIPCSAVRADDYTGAYMATEHLIRQGYKKIVHISGPEHLEISRNRSRGYTDAMNYNGMPQENVKVINTNFKREVIIDCLDDLFRQRPFPDAIFAANDPTALVVKNYVEDLGLKIPFHIGLVGFNDEPLSHYVRPKLSSVAIPTEEMGRRAVEILFKQIEDEAHMQVVETLPVILKTRESSNKLEYIQKNRQL